MPNQELPENVYYYDSIARDYAKTIDCYEMFLITNRSNISACKCYEKAGGINDADDEVVYVYDFREEN